MRDPALLMNIKKCISMFRANPKFNRANKIVMEI